jgi:hypothetical protein
LRFIVWGLAAWACGCVGSPTSDAGSEITDGKAITGPATLELVVLGGGGTQPWRMPQTVALTSLDDGGYALPLTLRLRNLDPARTQLEATLLNADTLAPLTTWALPVLPGVPETPNSCVVGPWEFPLQDAVAQVQRPALFRVTGVDEAGRQAQTQGTAITTGGPPVPPDAGPADAAR